MRTIWDKVFKNGPTEMHFKFFNGCLPQISLDLFLNTLSHIFLYAWIKSWLDTLGVQSYVTRLLLFMICLIPTQWYSKKNHDYLTTRYCHQSYEMRPLVCGWSKPVRNPSIHWAKHLIYSVLPLGRNSELTKSLLRIYKNARLWIEMG